MKLNQTQRYALMAYLVKKFPRLAEDHSFITKFDSFCNGEMQEWNIYLGLRDTKLFFDSKGEIYFMRYEELNEPVKVLMWSWAE
jgi:hypothetical protein